jgi:hypothetical protein
MAASDRSIRASDADRERVAASLRDHYAAGRLNGDEFNERLDKVYAATTLGELADVQTDLPAPVPLAERDIWCRASRALAHRRASARKRQGGPRAVPRGLPQRSARLLAGRQSSC